MDEVQSELIVSKKFSVSFVCGDLRENLKFGQKFFKEWSDFLNKTQKYYKQSKKILISHKTALLCEINLQQKLTYAQ